ncbi:MAG: precorrin-6y C5,15-methyltransferase (decarboxylating) subunit CbiE [Phormidesmis sp. RL_2_1]|nr:precorrin-6y C5,15-methyltransferase (decarboxylating) subunit CbiE [Phormidesmis sp. RL_2_1]
MGENQCESLVHVIGVGLSGPESLSDSTLRLVASATLLVGAQRHLDAFGYLWHPPSQVETWPLGNFMQIFADLRSRLKADPNTRAVVLASGDPLFFGLGRLLLETIPSEQLVFHPQVSAIQLAFSRLKLPWQDATIVSVHGRSEQLLIQALKRGDSKIAILTDNILSPRAIARLINTLDLSIRYRLWICENLGNQHSESNRERLSAHWPNELLQRQAASLSFSPLNVVVLLRQLENTPDITAELPLIGLPDSAFKGFQDRPALMTKREIRLLILGALAPLANQVIWDIGAGTGAVSIELSRLCPTAQLYAIEKTAIGSALIRQNAEQLAIAPIYPIQGSAPTALINLPEPDRVFIGGSSGQLSAILDFLHTRMSKAEISNTGMKNNSQTARTSDSHLAARSSDPTSQTKTKQNKRIVIALATVEHLSQVTGWAAQSHIATTWQSQLTQVNIARSLPVGPLTRFSPLNPVTLVTLSLIT